MAVINIKAPNRSNYNVIIEDSYDGFLNELELLDIEDKKILLISDTNIEKTYCSEILDIIKSKNIFAISKIFKAGSDIVDLSNVQVVCEILQNDDFDREDYVIAVGGSSIKNLAGYAAATYKGGMNFIYLPTTLFSMCEASINGSVNIGVSGSFIFPKFVYTNVKCIETLDAVDYFSGFAQAMKAGIIKSASAYEWLIENMYEISDKDTTIVLDMIEQTVNINKIYLDKDPYDQKDARILKLGYEIANAISVMKPSYKAGECLALGIIGSAHISLKKNLLTLDEYLEIRDMFVPFNLPITIDEMDAEKTAELICKKEETKTFVLLKRIGKAVIDSSVTYSEIVDALKELIFDENAE